ncbi:MAG: hypothetical protein GEU98_23895 [Pseudonocardiaceae bacterium]|nr:hypothetical protein [Pseudonocardiaceae bacterium]
MRAPRLMLIVLGLLVSCAPLAACGKTTWEGRLQFEIYYFNNSEADVKLSENERAPVSPGVHEIPRDVLPENLSNVQVVECHVTVRERAVVGGDMPSLVDDCEKVR